jgi:hypothetical protein
LAEELDIAAGDGKKDARFVMEPAKDLTAQRTGTSLFGEMKWDNEEHRMSFKMSCTYCHQVGTSGFRTPEEPVDWEVMITRMDGFGALHKDLKKTVVKRFPLFARLGNIKIRNCEWLIVNFDSHSQLTILLGIDNGSEIRRICFNCCNCIGCCSINL